jgi:hypothetical protein
MVLLEVPTWYPDLFLAIMLACYFFGIFIGSLFDNPVTIMYRGVMNKVKSLRGREITEQRRSGAAGLHAKHRKDRRNTKRLAIEQSRRD